MDLRQGTKIEGLRLVNGTAPTNGNLEVLVNGTWGTACGYGLPGDLRAATVMCRQLKLGTHGYLYNDTRLIDIADRQPSRITDITCTGEESSLQGCKVALGNGEDYCSLDVQLVECTRAPKAGYDGVVGNPLLPPTIQELRLVNGSASTGFLQVRSNNQWGWVVSEGLSPTAKLVACRKLGFSGVVPAATTDSPIAPWTPYMPTYSWNVSCTGREARLAACSFSEANRDAGSYPAYLLCTPAGGWQVQDIRLVNTTSTEGIISMTVRSQGGAGKPSKMATRGRLDVWVSGTEWGTVSNATFGTNEAVVACRTLLFPEPEKGTVYTLAELARDNRFGPSYYSDSFLGGGLMWVKAIKCTGQEADLMGCNVTWCDESCSPNVAGPVGVKCG